MFALDYTRLANTTKLNSIDYNVGYDFGYTDGYCEGFDSRYYENIDNMYEFVQAKL